MKRKSLLTASMLAAALSSCGGDSSEPETPTSLGSASPDPSVPDPVERVLIVDHIAGVYEFREEYNPDAPSSAFPKRARITARGYQLDKQTSATEILSSYQGLALGCNVSFDLPSSQNLEVPETLSSQFGAQPLDLGERIAVHTPAGPWPDLVNKTDQYGFADTFVGYLSTDRPQGLSLTVKVPGDGVFDLALPLRRGISSMVDERTTVSDRNSEYPWRPQTLNLFWHGSELSDPVGNVRIALDNVDRDTESPSSLVCVVEDDESFVYPTDAQSAAADSYLQLRVDQLLTTHEIHGSLLVILSSRHNYRLYGENYPDELTPL